MNQRQARAFVCRIAAELVDSDRDQGWIRDDDSGEQRDPADVARIERAIKDVAAMLLKQSTNGSGFKEGKRR